MPADNNYILRFPAGKPIGFPVSMGGNLFEQTVRDELQVTPRNDIYSHKDWISYDGKHWINADDDLELKVLMELPAHGRPQPGYMDINLSRKQ